MTHNLTQNDRNLMEAVETIGGSLREFFLRKSGAKSVWFSRNPFGEPVEIHVKFKANRIRSFEYGSSQSVDLFLERVIEYLKPRPPRPFVSMRGVTHRKGRRP